VQDPTTTGLNVYAVQSHLDNLRWWQTPAGERIERNKGELLMLIVSEIAEAMEGERKGLMDDKLPHRLMVEVELADALIRIFDYAGAYGLDIEGAYQEKREYNRNRADHTYKARAAKGGKKF
jgi:NTP pyrophosphatase (non-canonical NTP hydrolase)